MIWATPHGGYLDFVTHIETLDYWRPYVGQASEPKYRLPQHNAAIRNGSEKSLHYWIIKQGHGLRRANFIRLWSIPFPAKIDAMVTLVFENFLEMIMCRAFQSLPSLTLEEIFGPCPQAQNQGHYSGMGLNVVSPLLQGQDLGPQIRHQFTKLVEQSPDPEICSWPNFRAAQDRHTNQRDKLPTRRQMSSGDYHKALGEAIQTNPSLDQSLSLELDDWAQLDGELLDLETWFQSTSTKLQEQDQTIETGLICPFGTCNAAIGLILDLTPFHDYVSEDGTVKLPWGIQESGFTQKNSLVWTYNLQEYVHIPRSFQVAPPSPADIGFLRAATQSLINGSRLRVIIVCGDNSEDVAILEHVRLNHIRLSLYGLEYDAWIEISQSKILRIFIRAPKPLSGLWASHSRQAFDLTNVFRFVSNMTNTRMFSSFYESALSVSLIVRKWADERDHGLPKACPTDLEPTIKIWLAGKGFRSDEDLQRLAMAAGGSLRYGILILSHVLPKRKRDHSSQRLPRSKVDRRGVLPPDILANIRSLWQELSPQTKTSIVSVDERVGNGDGEVIEEADVDEDVIEEATEGFGILTEANYVASSTVGELEHALDLDGSDKPAPRFVNGLCWMLGQHYKARRVSTNGFRLTVRHLNLSFSLEDEPEDKVCVRTELSPIGERHPNVWAMASQEQDPGARLAFRISVKDKNGNETSVVYPTSWSFQSCCSANALVEEIEGDSFVDICQRPRRYMYIDRRCRRMIDAHPVLKDFVGGAYTDDNGEVITKNEGKRKRP